MLWTLTNIISGRPDQSALLVLRARSNSAADTGARRTVAPRRPLDETALRIVVVGRQHCAIDAIANGLLDRGGSRLHQMIVVVVVVVILQYGQGFRERQGEC